MTIQILDQFDIFKICRLTMFGWICWSDNRWQHPLGLKYKTNYNDGYDIESDFWDLEDAYNQLEIDIDNKKDYILSK